MVYTFDVNWDSVFGYVSAHLLSAGEKLQTVQDFARPSVWQT